MYQVKQRPLNSADVHSKFSTVVSPNASARDSATHDTSPLTYDATPQTTHHDTEPPPRRKSSYETLRAHSGPSRAQIAERRRAILQARELGSNIVLDERQLPYSACAREDAVVNFFSEPLSNGIEHGIPIGTLHENQSQGEPMDGSYIDTVVGATALDLTSLSPQVSFFIKNSRAASTRRLYRWAWDRSLRTCREFDICPMPMSIAGACSVIVDGINDGLVLGSLKIIAGVIAAAHEIAGEVDPTRSVAFRAFMRGVARTIGEQPQGKTAITVDDLRLIHAASLLHRHPFGVRDWAMIAVGFAGAMRRSEIVSRNVDDCEFYADHVRIWLDRSKTDQNRKGVWIIIQRAKDKDICPVEALRRWIALLPGPGPLFRPMSRHGTILPKRIGAHAVSVTVKSYGVVLDLAEDRLGAHSLRAGMITALIDADTPTEKTMKHSRHKHSETVGKYYRPRGLGPNMTEAAGM